eukprot:1798481-Rhodomonas_salina.1
MLTILLGRVPGQFIQFKSRDDGKKRRGEGYFAGLDSEQQDGKHSTTVWKFGSKKKGIEYRSG